MARASTHRWGGLAIVATSVIAAACADGTETDDGGDLVAAFYPLQFVTERVAGRTVSSLTPPGVEAHDVELSARDVTMLHDAALVVYLAGFSPAIDDAVEQLDPSAVFDVAGPAHLAGEPHEHDEHGDHADREDPHFWLDPTRLADVAVAVSERLAATDPTSAAHYAERAAALVAELTALDQEFAVGLAECAVATLVTSHAAFGHLAGRYGLTQVGIAGLAPDADPTPARLAEVTDFVTAHGVSTIYYETLVDPGVAETIAAETGASVAVLDPLEGLAEGTDGDYFSVMRTNLMTLRAGQQCR